MSNLGIFIFLLTGLLFLVVGILKTTRLKREPVKLSNGKIKPSTTKSAKLFSLIFSFALALVCIGLAVGGMLS